MYLLDGPQTWYAGALGCVVTAYDKILSKLDHFGEREGQGREWVCDGPCGLTPADVFGAMLLVTMLSNYI